MVDGREPIRAQNRVQKHTRPYSSHNPFRDIIAHTKLPHGHFAPGFPVENATRIFDLRVEQDVAKCRTTVPSGLLRRSGHDGDHIFATSLELFQNRSLRCRLSCLRKREMQSPPGLLMQTVGLKFRITRNLAEVFSERCARSDFSDSWLHNPECSLPTIDLHL